MAAVLDLPLSVEDLERAVRAADPAAMLAFPRILRRVIKHDRRITGVGLRVPHRKTYVIEAGRLLKIVDLDELGLPPSATLSGNLILLARPDQEKLSSMTSGEALVKHWRLLFHARVHVAFDQRIEDGLLPDATVRERVRRIGHAQFEEVRSVLKQEDFLLPPADSRSVYVEFAALYLELKFFAPALLAEYFPSIHDFARVDAVLADDIDAERLYAATRLPGAPDPSLPSGEAEEETIDDFEPEDLLPTSAHPSERMHRNLSRRADRTAAVGNTVRSAIFRARAARYVRRTLLGRARAAAQEELKTLADRLQAALDLSDDEARAWLRPLTALLGRSMHGYWTRESRTLYDLQKACVDHEREIYTLDLVQWALSRGRVPIKRYLPGQREVLMCKHLRSAARRAVSARLSDKDRTRLSGLIESAVLRAEGTLRERFRPLLVDALDRVELLPRNVPETVARHKIVEELLDRVVERGFLSMADLRDAVSRNSLKLPDLAAAGEFLRGDKLLRADQRLGTTLDGVYRRGEVYVRWPQRLSSLAFGTAQGRLLVRYVALPFGGAFVALYFLLHVGMTLAHYAGGAESHLAPTALMEMASGAVAAPGPAAAIVAGLLPVARSAFILSQAPDGTAWVLLLTWPLGLVLLGLINSWRLRRGALLAVRAIFRGLRMVFVRWPAWLRRQPLVRWVLDSPYFNLVSRYVLKPLVFTCLILAAFPALARGTATLVRNGVLVFLSANLLVNSRVGRNFEEVLADWAVRSWDHFRIRILAAVVHFIMDFFHRLLDTVDRVLYSVDEWLRFRSGQHGVAIVVKAVLGVVWFYVAYVVRFCITLLLEPQVNPVKHFPVVTVSHKILLSLSPLLEPIVVTPLESLMGDVAAKAVFWNGLLVIPGIFGYMAWELKENWRLYEANRRKQLTAASVGRHGETMIRLLRPGFHSGTVPKIYARLRRADRKAYWTGSWRASRKHRASLDGVRRAVLAFVERDLLGILEQSRRWRPLSLRVGLVALGSNNIRFELECDELGGQPLAIGLDEQSGWLLARVVQPGWLGELNSDQAQALTDALTGFYKLAGVDLVGEQLEALLDPWPGDFDLNPDGLVVWPDDPGASQISYNLNKGPLIQPQSSDRGAKGLPEFNIELLVFARAAVTWNSWVEVWQRDQAGTRHPPRLIPGTRLLPDVLRRAVAG